MTTATLQVTVDAAAARQELQRLGVAMQGVKQQGDRIERSTERVDRRLQSTAAGARLLQRAFAALVGVQTARRIIDIGNAFIGYDNALTAALGTTEQARMAMAFVRDEAERLGLPVDKLASGFTKLAASARGTVLEGEPIRDIFSSINEAARVMNLSVAETEGVLRAVTQIMSKGKVQAEELRGQLGERLPGAVRLLSEGLGITQQELDKMLEQGQILADQALPAFAQRLRETTAAGLELSQNSPAAEFQRLRNALLELAAAFAQGGFLDLLATGARAATVAVRFLTENMDALLKVLVSLAAGRVIGSVAQALNGVTIASAATTAATLRQNAAHIASAAAMRATAAAGTALRNVLAFLGGPVGVAVTAGTALVAFGGSAFAASGQTDALADSVDTLLGNMAKLEERQVSSAITALDARIQQQREQLESNQRLLDAIIADNPTRDAEGNRIFARGQEERVANLRETMQQLSEAIAGNEQNADALRAKLAELSAAADQAEGSAGGLERTAEQLADTQQRLNQIYGAAVGVIDPLAAEALAYSETMVELSETLRENPDLQARILQIQQAVTAAYMQSRAEASGLADAQKELAAAEADVARAHQAALQQIDPLAALTADYRQRMEALNEIAREHPELMQQVRAAQDVAARAFESARTAMVNQNDALDELNGEYEQLLNTLDPTRAAMAEYLEGVNLLNRAIRSGLVTSTEEAAEVMALLGKRFQEARESAANTQAVANPFAEAWGRAISRIEETFADVFTGAFDGFKEFSERLKDAFLQLLGELAQAALIRPILVNLGVTGQLANGAGGVANAAGGGGFGQAFGGLGQLFGGPGLGVALGASAIGTQTSGLGAGIGSLAGYALAGTTAGATLIGGGLTSLFGSGAASATLGSLGSVVPIVGTLLGFAIGSILDSVFGGDNPDPRIRLTNTNVLGTQYENEFTRASPFTFNGNPIAIQGQRITETFGRENSMAFLDAVQQFDERVADLLSAADREAVGRALLPGGRETFTEFTGDISVEQALEQRFDVILSALDPAIGRFVEMVGGSFEDRLNAFQVAIQLQDVVAASDVFENLGEALDFIANIPGDPAENLRAILQNVAAFETLSGNLRAFAESNVADEYAAAVRLANASLADQLAFVDETLQELISGIDPETASLEQLASVEQAVRARYDLELQLLAQIDQAASSISSRFASTVDFIRSTQQTDEERYNDLKERAEALAALLPTLTDPARILEVSNEIDRISREAFQLLSPEQQAIVAPELITFLEGVNEIAQGALAAARTAAEEAAQASRDLVGELVEALPEPLILAANALIEAAEALNPNTRNNGQPADPGAGGSDLPDAVGAAVAEAVGKQTDAIVESLGIILSEFSQTSDGQRQSQKEMASLLSGLARNGVRSRSRKQASNTR